MAGLGGPGAFRGRLDYKKLQKMPTNVPPQYREAEDRFREAGTTQAKIAALQEMMSIMPKHKGTDHLKAQLRARLSKLTAELEGAAAGKSGGRTEPFSLPKEGGGRATLVGPTNVGKSLLLVRATGAKAKVGAYALSTQEPVPGMLPYKDLRIQLVDTPPISNPGTQSRLYGLLRSTEKGATILDKKQRHENNFSNHCSDSQECSPFCRPIT